MHTYLEPPSIVTQPTCPRLGLFAWAELTPRDQRETEVVQAVVEELCRQDAKGELAYPVSVREANV